MAKTVFQALIDKYTEELEGLKEALSNGAASDMSKYSEIVGRIRGLRSAIQHTHDLAKNYMDDDDE